MLVTRNASYLASGEELRSKHQESKQNTLLTKATSTEKQSLDQPKQLEASRAELLFPLISSIRHFRLHAHSVASPPSTLSESIYSPLLPTEFLSLQFSDPIIGT